MTVFFPILSTSASPIDLTFTLHFSPLSSDLHPITFLLDTAVTSNSPLASTLAVCTCSQSDHWKTQIRLCYFMHKTFQWLPVALIMNSKHITMADKVLQDSICLSKLPSMCSLPYYSFGDTGLLSVLELSAFNFLCGWLLFIASSERSFLPPDLK